MQQERISTNVRFTRWFSGSGAYLVFPHLQARLASSCTAFAIFQLSSPDSSSPTLSSSLKVRKVEQRRCPDGRQSRQTNPALAATLPNTSRTSKMLDIRSHVLGKWRICCARFKQDWRMIFMLVLGDVVGHGLDPSNGINPLVGILVFLYLLPFFTGLLAGLFFGLAEKVTGDAPTKGNPRSRRKRKSRRNRKSMPNPPSQGNNSSNNNHSSKYKVPSISNSPSKGKALKVPPNFLARFAPEIRLQIFKDYFASFRPQRLYKESHYKEEWSLHLLNALRVCQDQTLYGEALEQYHKSSHFLFDGRSANKVFLESLQPWAVQSIKHITFGPR
jgi:hypothetical protein